MVFALCAAVLALFCSRKTGMFIDEVYSFGLSNSAAGPYFSDLRQEGLEDQLFTAEDIEEYLTVEEGSGPDLAAVYRNQSLDVHPPLYYWLLNLASSLFPGSCSVNIGTGLNALIFALTLLAFYFLVKYLYGSRDIACCGVVLFGTSVLAISMVMMIRMYTLMTLFTVLLAAVTAHIIRNPGKGILYPLLTLVVFCGVMSQYYFAFYAFFLCSFYDVYALVKKRYRSLVCFSLCALLGIGLLVLVFPACLKQLFVGNGQVVGGSSVGEALKNTSLYGEKISAFWSATEKTKALNLILPLGIAVVILAVLAGKIRCRRTGSTSLLSAANSAADSLLLSLPVVPAFLTVAVISPVLEHRYIYNLLPGAVLFVCFVLSLSLKYAGKLFSPADCAGYIPGKTLVCFCAVVSLWFAKSMPPDNLYVERQEFDALVSAHADSPCVYITDGYFAPVTQDMLQLSLFNSFFTTSDPESEKMQSYVGDADEAVLYIDTNAYWSSGYDPGEVIKSFSAATGLTESSLLYSFTYEGVDGLSSAYLMTR